MLKDIFESALDDIGDDIYDDNFVSIDAYDDTYKVLSVDEYKSMYSFILSFVGQRFRDRSVLWTKIFLDDNISGRIINILESTIYLKNLHLMLQLHYNAGILYHIKDTLKCLPKEYETQYIDITDVAKLLKSNESKFKFEHSYSSEHELPCIAIGFFFDIDESKAHNVKYCINCYKEFVNVVIKLNKLFKMTLLSNNTIMISPYKDFLVDEQFNVKEWNFYNTTSIVNAGLNPFGCSILAEIFNLVFLKGEDYYIASMIQEALKKDVYDLIKNVINAGGYNYKFLNTLKYEIYKKNLKVTIPAGTIKTFGDFNLYDLKTATKTRELLLYIDGVLYVNSLFELHNLKYLDEKYQHNKLVISCEITPKILRHILSKYSFKTLDLRKAICSTEMLVDMNNPVVKNKECNLLTNDSIIKK